MAKQTLTDFMDSLGPVEGFKPQPYVCADSDTLTMYFEDTPSFAERVDHELTVFKSFNSGNLVGFELKGVLPKMQQLASLIHVSASTPKIHVKLLLLICLADGREHRESYEGIAEKSSRFSDARIPVVV
ncbi:MAG: hypothetical protein L0287_02880 [Anaerolineae bacterium]|nr:hypothetical protein [Anaerolineae bacterium]